MRILVVGGGGREHAIVWKLAQSPLAEKIFCAPGNIGISELADIVDIRVSAFHELITFAKTEKIDLTIIGPDDPLAEGIADAFEAEGLKVFGPVKAAAQLESSKAFSKRLMQKYGIPTADYEIFNEYEKALDYVRGCNMPTVIKADGLALGKGVLICNTVHDAEDALREMFINKKFGCSGSTIVIEEFMTGHEVSVFAFCDGKTIIPMVGAQDHKRALDGDKGLNTGGMGAFSPSRFYTPEIADICMEKIFKPTLDALISEGIRYCGVIYFGLMLTSNGPRVVEYNARFGDPETQVVLPRMKSDLLEIIAACVDERLDEINIEWHDYACACIILASGGYPETYGKGYEITGIEQARSKNAIVFHAGTAEKNGKLVTNGGRVLGVTATGTDVDAALKIAYEATQEIYFDKMHYRKDIGKI